MALWDQPDRGIGRGEAPDHGANVPMLTLFFLSCAAGLFVFQLIVGDQNLTIALAVSLLVFGATVLRVEYGIYILIVAMMLSPEVEAGNVGASGERGLNLRYDDVLIVIIFLGAILKLAVAGRPLMWRPNPINAGIIAYYCVCVLSTIFALRISVPAWDKSVAFFVMLKMLEFYMIFFVVASAVGSMKEIERMLKVFFAVSLVVCAYGISSIGRLPRVSAPFEAGGTEPNTLGGYLMIIMCLAAGLYLYAPTRRIRYYMLGMGATAFLPFIMTLSRASYVSLFVAMGVIALLSRRTAVWGAIAVVLVLSPFLMPEEVMERIRYTFQPSGVPIEIGGIETDIRIDKSTYERVYVWEKVGYNLKIWPWFGGGISWDTVLDSQYARLLIETGIFGFTTFMFLVWRILLTTRQAFRWSRYWVAKGLSLAVFAITAGLLVHGLGTISFLIVRIMEPFWFLTALVVVAREIAIVDYRQRLLRQQAALTPTGAPAPTLRPQTNKAA